MYLVGFFFWCDKNSSTYVELFRLANCVRNLIRKENDFEVTVICLTF